MSARHNVIAASADAILVVVIRHPQNKTWNFRIITVTSAGGHAQSNQKHVSRPSSSGATIQSSNQTRSNSVIKEPQRLCLLVTGMLNPSE